MLYGLLGKKLAHSHSVRIHALLGNDKYELMELPEEGLELFLRAGDFKGVNITIPYKEKALALCMPDATARDIGCVNTVVNRAGKLYGYNTDYPGFLYMAAHAGVGFADKKVLILGTGGTAKTVDYAVRRQGAREVVHISRTGESHYGNLHRHADAQVLVNTTPVGMYPDNDGAPLGLEVFPHLEGVLDVIFNPLRTKLTLQAEERGIPAGGGLPMLLAQGYWAHRLFFEGTDVLANGTATGGAAASGAATGHNLGAKETAAVGDMAVANRFPPILDELYVQLEKQLRNIVLIGMPGSGKSTMGWMLAQKMRRPLLDTDAMAAQAAGKSPAAVIEDEGEAAFREAESVAVREAARQSGAVIATGGGAVLLEDNRTALRQNGFFVWIDRDLNKLATWSRPLSADVAALYRARRPLYEALADVRLPVTEELNTDMQALCAAVE